MNKKPRVLIVDDMPDSIEILISVLKDEFSVIAANNGPKAIEIASKEPAPDIILLDVMMKGMDGYEVCKILKDNDATKDIPIIFVTALGESENELHGLQLGAVDYITKPINSELVKARVHNHHELKQYRDNLKHLLEEKEEIMISQSRNAAMGEMIRMIAHQWRQPISTVSAIANSMLVNLALNKVDLEEFDERTKSIIEQTVYMTNTIKDFKDFFLPNKLKDNVKLEDVIAKAQSILGNSLVNNNISISLKHKHSIFVKTFSNELLQVYINLISNAKDALIENRATGRHIEIVISDDDQNIITSICDNGGGIDQAIIDKIFAPYYSTKSEKSGTGLGLYMSKVIVEKHLKGTLTAQNSEDGVCFKVSIPKVDTEDLQTISQRK